jgi:hypothetical protein
LVTTTPSSVAASISTLLKPVAMNDTQRHLVSVSSARRPTGKKETIRASASAHCSMTSASERSSFISKSMARPDALNTASSTSRSAAPQSVWMTLKPPFVTVAREAL